MVVSPAEGFRQRPQWLLGVLLLLIGQAGLATQLFGSGGFGELFDERPILNGRHPLHLYHGGLGAATFRERQAISCYDPAFQAGYPKTPVFDSGCRFAELTLYCAGTHASASAYKFGLLAVCVMVPLIFTMAARGFGMSPAAATLAGLAGCLVWWSNECQAAFFDGEIDLLLAGCGMLLVLGGLSRYAMQPGLTGWGLLTCGSLITWMLNPLIAVAMLPVYGIYYLVGAPRHTLAWHLGFIGVPVIGLVPNLWWLTDWCRFWWLRQPSAGHQPGFQWANLLGNPTGYLELFGSDPIVLGLSMLAIPGLLLLWRRGASTAVFLMLLGVLMALLAARLVPSLPPGLLGTPSRVSLLLQSLLVMAGTHTLAQLALTARIGPILIAALCLLPALPGYGLIPPAFFPIRTFSIGLDPSQEMIIQTLRSRTEPTARILLEEPDTRIDGWNWTALLPQQCERAFLGGIDPDAAIEHLFCDLRRDRLAGRPFELWAPSERNEFCKQYNVGWVLVHSPEAIAFWKADPRVVEIARFDDTQGHVLLQIQRQHQFVLAGAAKIERADRSKIVLTDVVPNELGEVILSFHYQPELRVTPLVAEVTRSPDPHDPIPFLKLRLPGPVSRLTLQWEHP